MGLPDRASTQGIRLLEELHSPPGRRGGITRGHLFKYFEMTFEFRINKVVVLSHFRYLLGG